MDVIVVIITYSRFFILKVLEVCVTKDSKKRKSVEYLIHFSGWSNTWDRCVSEEFILKDNEENRNLQMKLAAAAAVHL